MHPESEKLSAGGLPHENDVMKTLNHGGPFLKPSTDSSHHVLVILLVREAVQPCHAVAEAARQAAALPMRISYRIAAAAIIIDHVGCPRAVIHIHTLLPLWHSLQHNMKVEGVTALCSTNGDLFYFTAARFFVTALQRYATYLFRQHELCPSVIVDIHLLGSRAHCCGGSVR